MEIDFHSKRILKGLLESKQDYISINTILDIIQKDKYLPNNRSDAYLFLNKLIILEFLKQEKRGIYSLDESKAKAVVK